ncbi:hypothetical protein BDQ17DRAFT_1332934 [Cyathus striatus]|nr:hypothetical protein BDQ17DRAFT_1332934 [Cyathus striatus]
MILGCGTSLTFRDQGIVNKEPMDYCRLEKLVLPKPEDDDAFGDCAEMAETVIKIHKDTLTDVEYPDTFILFELNLSNFPRLKNLKLGINVDEDPTDLFKVTIQLMSAAPKGNEVRKIQIDLFFVFDFMHFIDKSNGPTNWRFYDETHLLGWKNLDVLFMESTFDQLEKVYFSF